MADAKAKTDKGMMTTAVVILLLSLMGAGVGFAVGIFIQPGSEEAEQASHAADARKATDAAETTPEEKAEEQNGGEENAQADVDAKATATAEAHLKIIALPPVVTTLVAPEGKWVRFEGAILVEPAAESPPELLAEQSGERVLAYLRTLRLEQLQGPSGLMALKDDLNDTVAVLSKGQVRGLLIHGLLVE